MKKHSSILYALIPFLFLAACQQKQVTQPVRKDLEEAVFASGFTEQEENYTVSAAVEGIILSLPVQEGDTVAQNEVVAIIENEVQNNQLQDALVVYQDAVKRAAADSPELQNLQTQIDQAKEQLAFDEENFQRYKTLSEKKSVAQLDFEKAQLQFQAAQSNLAALEQRYQEVQNNLALNVQRSQVQVNTQKSLLQDYALTTETAGMVIKVFKKQGELARRGEAIARIGSGDFLIRLFVSEDDITKIEVGLAVAVSLNTYPDRVFPARITKIYPGFDEAEQSYIVEARFEKFPEKMFSGTQLQANIAIGSRKKVLVIPTEYLSRGSYVQLENGEERQIVTGNKNGTWTEVVSGISEGEGIVKPEL